MLACFLDLIFSLENGDSAFIRNVGKVMQYYTATIPKESHDYHSYKLKFRTQIQSKCVLCYFA